MRKEQAMAHEEATKKIKLKTVTPEQFKTFGSCWPTTTEEWKRFRIVSALRPEWTALDVLALPDVSAKDKLWYVLREEFLPAELLHEFACRCAEYALTFVKEPDPRSIAAIEARRAWLRGEITDDELDAAGDAAWAVAGAALHARDTFDAVWHSASSAGWSTGAVWCAASACDAVEHAASSAASAAADSAWDAAQDTVEDAGAAARDARDAARDHEVEMLVELIRNAMQNDLKNDLKPCPFCGCDIVDLCEPKNEPPFIICENCLVAVQNPPDSETLVEMWNRRTEYDHRRSNKDKT